MGDDGKLVRDSIPDIIRASGRLPVIRRVAFWFKQVGGRTPKAGGDLLDGRTWKQHYDGMEVSR